MKILQINESYSESGGQEKYFFGLINGLKAKGFDVYSFGFGDKNQSTEKSLVLKLSSSYIKKQFNRFLFDFSTYRKLRKWVNKINPDIIHLHGLNNSTFALIFACRGYKVVQTVHNFGLFCPTIWSVTKDNLKPCYSGVGIRCCIHKCLSWKYLVPFFFHIKIKNLILKKYVSVFHAPSKAIQETLEINGFKNIRMINYFVDINIAKLYRKKRWEVLYIGRLDLEKGVSYLIDALSLIKKKGISFKTAIIGEGPEKRKLITKSTNLHLQKDIDFLGYVPFDKVNYYYSQSKIFVMPSIYMEQFGLVGIEAMAYGLPTIASNRGGITEWCINDKTGFVIEPTCPYEIADKIITLIKNTRLAKEMGSAGKKEVKRFEKEKRMEDIINLYNELSSK